MGNDLTTSIHQFILCKDSKVKARLKHEIIEQAEILYGTAESAADIIQDLVQLSSASGGTSVDSPVPLLKLGQKGSSRSERGHPSDNVRLLRLKEVLHILPCSASTWWAWVSAGKAPAPIKLGPRTTCWRLTDIVDFIENSGRG